MMKFARLFRQPATPAPPLDPTALITEPAVAAHVHRLPGGAWQVRWTKTADSTDIHTGPTPDAINWQRPIARVARGNQFVLEGKARAAPTYFGLRWQRNSGGSRRLIVAERTLPLAGAFNFRDLGGYETADGQRVRWGRVYRAGMLVGLTDNDLAYLSQLQLKTVYDLRTADELAQQPDRLPTNAAPHLIHLPVQSPDGRLTQMLQVWRLRNRLGDLLLDIYTRVMIDHNTAVLRAIFQRLAEPVHLPAVIHCTAGKDRTGVVVALLLSLLGISDEVISADYSLSNYYYNQFIYYLQRDLERLNRFRFTPAQIQPVLVADPTLIQAMLRYVRQRYGSITAYVRGVVGVDSRTVTQLKSNLLQ